MIARLTVLPGDSFGFLTCIEEMPRRDGMRLWRLRCDCGAIVDFLQKSFCSGGKRNSCGCKKRRSNHHNLSDAQEYRHWVNMISRCENPNIPGFQHYGGRGIKVCDQWRRDFALFYADMGPRPTPEHSLDRIDVNGNYEPTNCRWAGRKTQCRNTRTNRHVTINGKSMTLAEAVESAPVSYNTVLYRLKRGWSLDNALTLTADRRRRLNG